MFVEFVHNAARQMAIQEMQKSKNENFVDPRPLHQQPSSLMEKVYNIAIYFFSFFKSFNLIVKEYKNGFSNLGKKFPKIEMKQVEMAGKQEKSVKRQLKLAESMPVKTVADIKKKSALITKLKNDLSEALRNDRDEKEAQLKSKFSVGYFRSIYEHHPKKLVAAATTFVAGLGALAYFSYNPSEVATTGIPEFSSEVVKNISSVPVLPAVASALSENITSAAVTFATTVAHQSSSMNFTSVSTLPQVVVKATPVATSLVQNITNGVVFLSKGIANISSSMNISVFNATSEVVVAPAVTMPSLVSQVAHNVALFGCGTIGALGGLFAGLKIYGKKKNINPVENHADVAPAHPKKHSHKPSKEESLPLTTLLALPKKSRSKKKLKKKSEFPELETRSWVALKKSLKKAEGHLQQLETRLHYKRTDKSTVKSQINEVEKRIVALKKSLKNRENNINIDQAYNIREKFDSVMSDVILRDCQRRFKKLLKDDSGSSVKCALTTPEATPPVSQRSFLNGLKIEKIPGVIPFSDKESESTLQPAVKTDRKLENQFTKKQIKNRQKALSKGIVGINSMQIERLKMAASINK